MVDFIENVIIRGQTGSDNPIVSCFSDAEVNNEYKIKATVKLVQKSKINSTSEGSSTERDDFIFIITDVAEFKLK